jgi:hypothetical protein
MFSAFVANYILRNRIKTEPFALALIIIGGMLLAGGTAIGIGTLLNALYYALTGSPYPGESSESIRLYMVYTVISVMISIVYGMIAAYTAVKRYLPKAS